jgi:hypothetical protein
MLLLSSVLLLLLLLLHGIAVLEEKLVIVYSLDNCKVRSRISLPVTAPRLVVEPIRAFLEGKAAGASS